MTASAGAKFAASKVKSTFQDEEQKQQTLMEMYAENGELVATTLGELKGAAMKVGQMASMASDLLPPELTEKLKKLQNDSPPMSFDEIEKQIERELGQPIALLFDDFDEEPFAAASIGQVHRARVDDGREVVVKVQYPGVDESCDSDLRHMERVFLVSGFATLNRKASKLMFAELRRMLHEELDYTLEADNVRRFRKMHHNDDLVVLPEVVGERSAKRVLTLTFVDGDSIEEVADSYSQEQRNLVGTNLYKLFGIQMFRERLLHGDPHPGNFAFRRDGRIVLYDFGCVKEMSADSIAVYRDVCLDALEWRFERMDQHLLDLDYRVPDREPIPESFYETWADALITPMMETELYDYGKSDTHERVKKLAPLAIKHALDFQPSAKGAIIDRLVFGLHQMFRKIGPQFDWIGLMEEQAAYAKDL